MPLNEVNFCPDKDGRRSEGKRFTHNLVKPSPEVSLNGPPKFANEAFSRELYCWKDSYIVDGSTSSSSCLQNQDQHQERPVKRRTYLTGA